MEVNTTQLFSDFGQWLNFNNNSNSNLLLFAQIVQLVN